MLKTKGICFLFVLILLLDLFCVASADELNLSELSFSDLYDLRQKVETEYRSRSEAEPFLLQVGEYMVGVDLLPGRYYVACVSKPNSMMNPHLVIYPDKKAFEENEPSEASNSLDSYFGSGDAPKNVALENENVICVENNPLLFSLSNFNTNDYLPFNRPDGTLVPVGVYVVDEEGDIPAGKYQLFPGSGMGGRMYIYTTREQYDMDNSKGHEGCDKAYAMEAQENPVGEGVILEEGSIVLVESDVILNKQKH